ncbi:hypothetical protein PIB30_076277 [Stylosanthes scabra]|uniref:Uncharacterized protein n=1 Tax=Stylosanthes scabra TaxID=79078 RepID=A0ABU6SQD6_9FABA|nr:hypothetical protein [Stylosanthes scabra]
MARIANRNDINRMFKSTILLWPLDEDCIVDIPGNRIRDDFPFPPMFIQKFGAELDMFVYMIDGEDNAHEILLDYHNGRPFISVVSLNDLEVFYSIKRLMSLSLRYVGHGLFFLSLFDRHRHQLEIFLEEMSYVPCVLPNDHLDYIESQLQLKYIVPTSSDSDVGPIELSPDPSSSDGFEFLYADYASGGEQVSDSGDVDIIDEHTFTSAVNQSRRRRHVRDVPNARYLGFGIFEITINKPLLDTNRIYLPAEFARDVRRIRGSRRWTVRGPDHDGENEFGFKLLPSRGRTKEWKLGGAWLALHRAYGLRVSQWCTFEINPDEDHVMNVLISG